MATGWTPAIIQHKPCSTSYRWTPTPICLRFVRPVLGLVLINGAFKYIINVVSGRTGERLLRRLRYQLYTRMLRFPLPQFRKTSQGELIAMITAEVEPLGGFMGT